MSKKSSKSQSEQFKELSNKVAADLMSDSGKSFQIDTSGVPNFQQLNQPPKKPVIKFSLGRRKESQRNKKPTQRKSKRQEDVKATKIVKQAIEKFKKKVLGISSLTEEQEKATKAYVKRRIKETKDKEKIKARKFFRNQIFHMNLDTDYAPKTRVNRLIRSSLNPSDSARVAKGAVKVLQETAKELAIKNVAAAQIVLGTRNQQTLQAKDAQAVANLFSLTKDPLLDPHPNKLYVNDVPDLFDVPALTTDSKPKKPKSSIQRKKRNVKKPKSKVTLSGSMLTSTRRRLRENYGVLAKISNFPNPNDVAYLPLSKKAQDNLDKNLAEALQGITKSRFETIAKEFDQEINK